MIKDIETIDTEYYLTVDKLREAEQELGFSLPDNYKEFLFKNNGGHPIKDSCTLLESYTNNELNFESGIAWFFAIYDGEYNNLVRDYLFMKDWRIQPELLTIARDGLGNRFCLCIKGPNQGKVYFWFHENENPEENNPWYQNISLVAHSFENFINSLHRFELDWDRKTDETLKTIRIHDRYSLPLSRPVQRFGNKVTDFFAKASAEVEDFVIEEIEASGNIILYYIVKSQKKQFIREINQLGVTISEREEAISTE